METATEAARITPPEYQARGDMAVMKAEKLNLGTKWDKCFPKSDKVDHRKVTFVNRFGSRYVHAQEFCRQATRHCCLRRFRSRQGAAFRPLCAEHGGAGLFPGAIHCDLYDGGTHGYIPFDKLESFFKTSFHEVRP